METPVVLDVIETLALKLMNAAYVMVTAHPVLPVLGYQMVTVGIGTVDALLQIMMEMTVMIVLVFQMVLTLIRDVVVEYMISYQQMAVMMPVVLLQ